MKVPVGGHVFVPGTGVGYVAGSEVLDIAGDTHDVWVIHIIESRLVLRVPKDAVKQNRIRPLIDLAGMLAVLEALATPAAQPEQKATWNRRYKRYSEQMKTGDPFDVAAILRELTQLKRKKSLSFGETRVLDTAWKLLIQELAVVRNEDSNLVKQEVEKILAA